MTKAELIDRIVRSRDLPPDITKKCVAQIVDLAFTELSAYFVRTRLTKNNVPRFTYPGFGTFTKKKRSPRRGVNPQSLEPMMIEGSFTLDFKPSSALRQALNAGKRPGTTRKGTSGPRKAASPRKAPSAPGGLVRRRLTTREETEDFDDVSPEDLFGEDLLPPGPMQRTRRRGGGSQTGTH